MLFVGFKKRVWFQVSFYNEFLVEQGALTRVNYALVTDLLATDCAINPEHDMCKALSNIILD